MTVADVLDGGARFAVEQADALAFLRSLPAQSVDLIATDPPYFRVKDLAWDRAWSSADAFVAWIGELADEWLRVLRPNGSLYVFASSTMAARVEVEIARRFEVLNSIVWRKQSTDDPRSGPHGRVSKPTLRAFFPQTERIVFAEHKGADLVAKGEAGYAAKCDEARGLVFEPIRAYIDGERERAGMSRSDVDRALGNCMSGHYFSRVQWALPTRANYEAMRVAMNERGGSFLRREYDDLRREYDDLRRPFRVSADVPFTDVWEFRTVGHRKGKHPCEKPADLARHIVQSSSRPGAVVLDTFAGSGAFLAEAVRLGRRAIGCDMDARWAESAAQRCSDAAHDTANVAQIDVARVARRAQAQPPQPAQRNLFDAAVSL